MAAIECALTATSISLFTLGVVQFSVALIGIDVAYGAHVVAGLVACGAYFYGRRLERPAPIWREWLTILLPFVLVARVIPYAFDVSRAAEDISAWMVEPLAIFDGAFLFRIALLFTAWLIGFSTTADLVAVRVQPSEVPVTSAKAIIERGWESDRLRAFDHTAPLVRLAGRQFGLGLGLLVLTALSSLSVGQRLSLDALGDLFRLGRVSVESAQMTTVAYFLATLTLIGHAYHSRQRSMWSLDSVSVAPGLSRVWAVTGIGVISAAVFVAFALPTSGLLGLADIVHLAFSGLVALGSYVMLVVFFLIWLLSYPFRMLGSAPDVPALGAFQPPASIELPPSDTTALEVLRTLLIWALVLGLPLYSAGGLWMRREGAVGSVVREFVAWLGRRARDLARLLLSLINVGSRAAGSLVELLSGRNQSVPTKRSARVAERGAGYRAAIVAHFSAALSRAARHGVVREQGQTALEWAPQLARAIPDAATEVGSLAELFSAARYGRADPSKADASVAQRAWSIIHRQLTARPRVR